MTPPRSGDHSGPGFASARALLVGLALMFLGCSSSSLPDCAAQDSVECDPTDLDARGDADPSSDLGSETDGSQSGLSIALNWDAPMKKEDGSPLSAITGYRVYYGTAPSAYTDSVNVGNVLAYTFTALPAGTYYFALTVTDTGGTESLRSGEVQRTIP